MPINIFASSEGSNDQLEKSQSVAFLCVDVWELPVQLFEFERWLEADGKNLPNGSYIADIGFKPRTGACGGGGVLSVTAMHTLAMLKMEVWFSEYED